MSSPKDQIKERLSIEDCISSYIKISPAGKNFKALCPFHNEKTPSFFISPERNSYYCFGCGAGGDIFSFVEQFEGVDFRGALKILGERTGIDTREGYSQKSDGKEILYEIMENAVKYFESELEKEKEVRAYLLKRGLSDNTIKDFRIGYAPSEWRSVSTFLIKSGYKKDDLLKIGLIKKSEKDDGFYDRFRSRIMFPVSDSSGRVIAFSGRLFEKEGAPKNAYDQAKYINSIDSEIYNKSNTLFGIDKAKLNIRKKGYTILVEGQFDLLLSHQIGLDNTVAISGTALASDTNTGEDGINNLGLIRRLSPNIIFAFDGDEAGMRATRRSAMIAFSLGMEVKVANAMDGRDPADIIMGHQNEWKDKVRNAKHIISFEIDKLVRENKDKNLWSSKIHSIIFPYLKNIKSNITQSGYIKEIHDKTGIPENALYSDFENYQKMNLVPEKKEEVNEKQTSRIALLEKQFFSIIFLLENNPESKEKALKYINLLIDSVGKDTVDEMKNKKEPFRDRLVLEAEMWYGNQIDNVEKDLDEVVMNLEEEILLNKARSKMDLIRSLEIEGKTEGKKELLSEYQDIVKKIEEIKNKRN